MCTLANCRVRSDRTLVGTGGGGLPLVRGLPDRKTDREIPVLLAERRVCFLAGSRMAPMIPLQPFGRTGHESSRIIFGAAALSEVTQDEADDTMELIRRHRINHLDVAASYGGGRLAAGPLDGDAPGRVLLGHQDRRAYPRGGVRGDPALAWQRLRTDHVDLIQLHNLVDEDGWQTAFAPGGALEAAIQAPRRRFDPVRRRYWSWGDRGRPAPAVLRAVRLRFGPASVQLPDVEEENYIADFDALEAPASSATSPSNDQGGCLWPWGDDRRSTRTWYQPLKDQASIDPAVGWALGREGVFLYSAAISASCPSC